ncbi:hypothetical protein [Streptomyces sp. AC550_RSS872]|uniref:hypothetical protein n=1 Tax=Streptomyces sp. AC550_RSS872 TaxID=2823689 RepID=UPI001C26676C|nr:hypothetical protein [Streptomyces sp. AC550_RSS872]
MHDSDSASSSPSSPDPQSPSGPPASPGGSNTVGVEEAHQILGTVIAWYNRQLLLARRSDDQQRLEELTAQRQECVEDQVRLREAGPEETARLADVYTELLKELEASVPQSEA